MRVLLILRGAPGSGKTTWIKDNHLIPYTLSFDNMRMLFKSPIQTIYGKESSDRKSDSMVSQTMLKILEERMKTGELTVIDSVNSKKADISQYEALAIKYRYKTYLIDLSNVPIKVAKERNINRMSRKRVPDHIIDRIYQEFETEGKPDIDTIAPEKIEDIWPKPVDLNRYKKVHHIGDIHGCYEVLKRAIGEFHDDECYIFLGDYTDRGHQNAEVIQLMLENKGKENVIFCEGNHERWVWNWACGIHDYTEEFERNTMPKLEESGIDKKEVRKLYRTLKECFYYKYHGKVVLACHGGIAAIPQNLATISSRQLIHGVGLYSDVEQVAKTFADYSDQNRMQIFGHRNPDNKKMALNESVYCLEGKVEAGGELRILTLSEDKIIEKLYKN